MKDLTPEQRQTLRIAEYGLRDSGGCCKEEKAVIVNHNTDRRTSRPTGMQERRTVERRMVERRKAEHVD